MLFKLREFVQKHNTVSLATLSQQFDRPPEVLGEMMNRWIVRGEIEIITNDINENVPCSHGSCKNCHFATPVKTVQYRWIAK